MEMWTGIFFFKFSGNVIKTLHCIWMVTNYNFSTHSMYVHLQDLNIALTHSHKHTKLIVAEQQ